MAVMDTDPIQRLRTRMHLPTHVRFDIEIRVAVYERH